jgi:hypothetical protein
MMILLKVAREKAGHKTDNFVDIAGYAACAEEVEVREPFGDIHPKPTNQDIR